MRIRQRGDCPTPVDYLRQFDLHNHLFSHCVNEVLGKPKDYWTREKPHVEEKLHEITDRLQRMLGVVEKDAREHQAPRAFAITEHPQFTWYGIPITRYLRKFARESQSSSAQIFWGLETDIEIAKDKSAFVNRNIFGDEQVGRAEDLLERTQVIIGSLHAFKPWRNDLIRPTDTTNYGAIASYDETTRYIRNTNDYFDLTINAINDFGRFRTQIQEQFPAKRAFVYGHFWGAAWNINKRAYEQTYEEARTISTRALRRVELKEKADIVQDFIWSKRAPIQFFTEDHLKQIADTLLDHEIALEINRMYIHRGASEFCKWWPGTTLLEVYIDRARARSMTPTISICSDAHCANDYHMGDAEAMLERICTRVPNITHAQVWAEGI